MHAFDVALEQKSIVQSWICAKNGIQQRMEIADGGIQDGAYAICSIHHVLAPVRGLSTANEAPYGLAFRARK